MGTRTVGCRANEIEAPAYLVRTLHAMREAAAMHGVEIELQLQHPSGSFATGFLDGFVNTYTNVTNVCAPSGDEAKSPRVTV